ncbi:MAG: transposase [Dorea sp.]|nr:transposase [Dorea sp.]
MAEKDMVEKTLESYNDVFADIVNVLLFKGAEKIKEEELKPAVVRSVYKVDQKLREQERDTAKYWKKHNLRISLYGLENETSPEDDVPLRVFGYDGAAYRDQIFYEKGEDGKYRRNTNPRYPVITLVLYFGTKHWNKPTTIYECVADNLDEDMKPFVTNLKINLFEIAFLSDEQVAMFKSDFRIVADYFVQIRKNKNYIPTDTQFGHVKEVLQMMSVLTKDNRFEEAANAAIEGEVVKDMCDVLDYVERRGEERGEKRGEKRGEEQGERRGEMKKAREIAVNLKARGFSNTDIADLIGVEIGIVENWFPGGLAAPQK